jgi:hypothetical protein
MLNSRFPLQQIFLPVLDLVGPDLSQFDQAAALMRQVSQSAVSAAEGSLLVLDSMVYKA